MASHKYFRVPFSSDTLDDLSDALKDNSFMFATEHDYEFFTVDLGPDTDGESEKLLQATLRKHKSKAFTYYVAHEVRAEHFYVPPKKRKGKKK